MKIRPSVMNGAKVFYLEGNLDSVTSVELQAAVLPAANEAPARIVLDFNQVGYVSSAGLRVVLMTAKQARAAGGNIAIFGLTNPVRETFEISGFSRMIPLVETQADALGAVTG